ncbi:MAG: sugar transferase [Deltaproteobacteria bacterium]|nr:sugar transferase [Deltaproteobacteria bacterium]
MVKKKLKSAALTLYVSDIVFTAVSFYAAYLIRGQWFSTYESLFPFSEYAWLMPFIVPIWTAALYYSGGYRIGYKFSLTNETARMLGSSVAGVVALTAVIFLTKSIYFSRLFLIIFGAVNFAALVLGRALVRPLVHAWMRRPMNVKNAVVVGDSPQAVRMAELIKGHKALGLNFLGFISEGNAPETRGRVPVLGGISTIEEVIRRHVVDEVIFVVSREKAAGLEDVFLMLEDHGINARMALSVFPHMIAKVQIEEFEDTPLLTFTTLPTDEAALFMKRVIDVVLSFVFLVVGAPFIALIALIVKADSKGPVLFVQKRCGINGRPFSMYKFRSMYIDAEKRLPDVRGLNEMDGPVFKMKNDPRITRVGRALRKMSLDELPQLWNVLRGDMSIVGPRPPIAQEVARYERWQRRRLSMKPGLTCIWQVSGRNEIAFEDWMRLDLQYIDNWSLWLDFKILVKTIPAVMFGRGAR